MIAVRFALYGVLGSLFGLSTFGLYGLQGDFATLRQIRPERLPLSEGQRLAVLAGSGVWLWRADQSLETDRKEHQQQERDDREEDATGIGIRSPRHGGGFTSRWHER